MNRNSHRLVDNSEACERIARKNFEFAQQEVERVRIEKAGEDGAFKHNSHQAGSKGLDEEEPKKTPFPKEDWDRINFYVQEFREPKWREIVKANS